MGKKKTNLAPKRKRMNRKGRLLSGKEWIKTYKGKNIVKSYAKWFGVNKICAMTELEMLGIQISEKTKMNIKQGETDKVRARQLRKKRSKEQILLENYFYDYSYDFDDIFSSEEGYIEETMTIGITYEEQGENDKKECFSYINEFGECVYYDSPEDMWLDYLLVEQQTTDTNEFWYSDNFEWESYFGHLQPAFWFLPL
ncbi:hypothetical protein [Bacillus sp. Marseille-P3661]|uniref:hypothetical protein n=1 Tax=Bacillus sp. Marseille-P3661 TaxID=1936234 RepID=UPI000C81DA92|nr:hypothetical protein [Bacillus sp. Marseille-P3661]